MAYTLREIKDRTLRRIGAASGPSVATYAEEPIQEIIQHKIDVLFDMQDVWWPQYYEPGLVIPIDSNGLPTIDLSTYIKDFKDIRFIFLGNEEHPLPIAPVSSNLANVKLASVVSNPDAARPFRIIGNRGAHTTVTAAFKTRPEPLENDQDEILMDDHLIILGSAYDYLNGLGLNPSEEDKLLTLFNQRLGQLTGIVGMSNVALQSYSAPSYPTEWSER